MLLEAGAVSKHSALAALYLTEVARRGVLLSSPFRMVMLICGRGWYGG